MPWNFFRLENHVLPHVRRVDRRVIRTKENAFTQAQIWRQSDFPVVVGFVLLQGCVILLVRGIHYDQSKIIRLAIHCSLVVFLHGNSTSARYHFD